MMLTGIDAHRHNRSGNSRKHFQTETASTKGIEKMKNITIDTIIQAVIKHGDHGKNHPRLYEIYASLVQHPYSGRASDGDIF
jgi:hypothetical protein